MAQRVGTQDGVCDHLGRHLKRHVAHGVLGRARSLGNNHGLLARKLGNAKFLHRDRQTQLNAEALDFLELLGRGILEYQLDDGAEGDLLAVIHAMALGQHRQTVVDGMSSSKA